jgi:glycosyltransferase involved in cell wall biosynthesis
MVPKVSVICLSYNHERFLVEALDSVYNQSYGNIEIIIVDDASKDSSQQVIENWLIGKSSIKYFPLQSNVGNCKAFNIGYAHATGDYVIDFATDDVMLSGRIEKQVLFFETLDATYGVVFTDSVYIDEDGKFLRNHFEYLFRKKLLDAIPQGDVYCRVIDTYFISSPTMMVRKSVMDALGGYDESLAYEDFDFWVRSARNYKYAYLPEQLTKVRKVRNSLSTQLYTKQDTQVLSTLAVCKKIKLQNRNLLENIALINRVKYEYRQCVITGNFKIADSFKQLLLQVDYKGRIHPIWIILRKLQVPLHPLRKLYHWIFYQ